MLKIAVIGGGSHSRGNHLPALARYVSLYPAEVELAAFCDLQREVVERVSREYGFTRFYADLEEMLGTESLDGCIAVTPISATARVAKRIISAGIPLLMEKPPGATVEEAEEIRALIAGKHGLVMVSMNRRFDPAISAACSWKAGRPLAYLRAAMFRHERREEEFFVGTAIHCLDIVRGIAGDVRDYSVRVRQVDGVWWYFIELTFENGATGVLEVMPHCGNRAEFYEMFGAGFRVLVRAGEVDSGEVTCWEYGEIAHSDEPARGMPPFVKNGTYAETLEFISALKENRPPHPSLAEVWQSVELCHRIQREVIGTRAQQ